MFFHNFILFPFPPHPPARLSAFYAAFKPEKLGEETNNIAKYFADNGDELNAELRATYGSDLGTVRPTTLLEKLQAFYAKHNPEKLHTDLAPIVEYYEDDEQELNEDLRTQYDGADLNSVSQFVCDAPPTKSARLHVEEKAHEKTQREAEEEAKAQSDVAKPSMRPPTALRS